MTGEISSNSSSLLSAPPPPPPLPPADWVKNCGQAESNDKNEKTSGSIASENSSSTKPTTVLSEGPAQLATEQKIDTPILINTLVGISKTAALKYSIATLLLCISSVTAGIYTYLAISATLSAPVLFIVIASVSSLVVLNLAVYLINSFVSAINSEKGVDPGREQSQDLQKAKGLEHSNTPTSSLSVTLGTSSAPTSPPPLPVKSNDLSTAPRVTRKSRPSDANPTDARGALFAQIREGGVKLKRVNNEVENAKTPGNNKDGKSQDLLHELNKKLKSRRKGIDGEEENGVQSLDGVYGKISSMIPPPQSQSSSLSSNNSDESWNNDDEYLSSPASELGRKESPDSGHDNIKPEPTTPPRSTLKAEKPPVPPKPPNLRVNL